jgi:hypothetical protein
MFHIRILVLFFGFSLHNCQFDVREKNKCLSNCVSKCCNKGYNFNVDANRCVPASDNTELFTVKQTVYYYDNPVDAVYLKDVLTPLYGKACGGFYNYNYGFKLQRVSSLSMWTTALFLSLAVNS